MAGCQDKSKVRELTLSSGFAVILALIPFGYSMPVVPKWIFWGLSYLCGVFILCILIPSLEHLQKPQKVGVHVAFLAVGFVLMWPTIHGQWREERAAAKTGCLNPYPGSGPIIVRFGPNSPRIGLSLERTVPILEIYGSKFSVRRKDRKILIGIEVRDRTGSIVTTMTDNCWQVSSAQTVSWDKNYSRDSIEVKDGRGRVILQLQVFPNEVYLQGEWWTEDGVGLRIVQVPGVQAGEKENSAALIKMDKTYHPDEPHIEEIFLYPSNDHFGEFK